MTQGHDHEHYFDHVYLPDSHDRNARRTHWVIALTAVTMVVEIVAGWMTGSMALLADGFPPNRMTFATTCLRPRLILKLSI